MKVEKSVVINQPVEKVFDFVSNAENEPLWRTEIQESRVTSEGAFGVGSIVNQTASFMGRRFEAVGEMTEYEPNQIAAWKLISGPFSGDGKTTYEAKGDNQTIVTISSNFDIGGFFKLAEPLVARSGRRQTEANLANLKDILEADADSGD
jgi:uncharacterized membrane protein